MKRWAHLGIALLLLAGLSVLLYPTTSNWIASRHHSQAIAEYTLTVEQLAGQEIERHLTEARAHNASLTGIVSSDAFSAAHPAAPPEEYLSTLNIGGMIGYVDIPAIDVHLPVYHTVSESVLRSGAGHLPESALPVGDKGDHAVITAHRGLPSAKLFTDLNKLEEGDVFFLHILGNTLRYRVSRILVVEPSETDALQPVPQEDLVTLITCTPYAINSHRLLVQGVREQDIATSPAEQPYEPQQPDNLWPAGTVAAIGLLAVLVVVLLAWRKRRAGG